MMEFPARRWIGIRAYLSGGLPHDGSITLRLLMLFALIAAVFVLAFAVFGEKVYEQFKELARQVGEAI